MKIVYNDSMIATRIKSELDKVKSGEISKANFTISVSDWNLTDGKYLAVISSSDLTADKYVEVFFDDSCSEIVTVAKISTEGETFEGGISITAENLPTDTISGSYYIFKGDSFMSKARVNTGSYQESTFVGATSITSGVAGNVPVPLAGDQNKFLCGNGQWTEVPSGGSTGSGDFVINGTSVKGASITGADVTFESDTAKISITAGSGAFTLNGAEVQEVTLTGADYSYDSSTKKASISITGGTGSKMTLNGAEITSASITGANVSIDGGNACITIKSAEAQSVTINGAESNIISISGAAQVSQGGGVTNLIIADRTPKLGANFSLSADNISLPAYTNATVSAVRLGDGVITAKGDRFASVETLTADSFKITGKKEGATNLGFWLGETATYYPAAKNLNVTVTENPMPVYFDFEDSDDLFKNAGYATITSITGAGAMQVDDGEGGKAVYIAETYDVEVDAELGGANFTIKARLKRKAYNEDTTFLQWSNWHYVSANANADEDYVKFTMLNNELYNVARFQVFRQSTFEVALNDDDWHDMKVIYYAAQQKAECYYDEELVHTFTGVTIAENALQMSLCGYIAEVQVFDKAL